MDWGYILNFIYEIAYFLSILGMFTVYAVFKGRQAIINVIAGLYLALLISIEFPSYDKIFENLDTAHSIAMAKLAFFATITFFTTALFFRIMPDEFREEKFETMGKKLLLAGGATVLVMIFSFHALPVTEFLTPGTPLQLLFAPEGYYFWWLLLPLVILFII